LRARSGHIDRDVVPQAVIGQSIAGAATYFVVQLLCRSMPLRATLSGCGSLCGSCRSISFTPDSFPVRESLILEEQFILFDEAFNVVSTADYASRQSRCKLGITKN